MSYGRHKRRQAPPENFVRIEEKVCVVCGKTFQVRDAATLLHKRLSEIPEGAQVTGFGNKPCDECEEMLHHDGERIALVGVDEKQSRDAVMSNGNMDPAKAHRTGSIAWLRRERWEDLFNTPCPEGPVVFAEEEVIRMLMSSSGEEKS